MKPGDIDHAFFVVFFHPVTDRMSQCDCDPPHQTLEEAMSCAMTKENPAAILEWKKNQKIEVVHNFFAQGHAKA